MDKHVLTNPPLLEQAQVDRRTRFIYLMRDDRNGLHKIGLSYNPKVREKTIQSEAPRVTLIAYFPGDLKEERSLHQLFSEQRVRGEWFDLSKEDIRSILNRPFVIREH